MKISDYLNINNLHHAYLIEGDRDLVVPELLELLEKVNIGTKANPDFYNIQMDTFKIDDARMLKSLTIERNFSNDMEAKKVFIIVANSFLLEAQNSLLKVFEEPMENTHFFVVVPSTQIFIPTLLSRFYVMKSVEVGLIQNEETENFIKLPLAKRLDFIKELLSGDDDEDEVSDSPRQKALKFLDALEFVLQKNIKMSAKEPGIFDHILKVRKYLRQTGSAPKMLLESVALSIPEKVL